MAEGIFVKIAINSVVEAGKVLAGGLLVEIKDSISEEEYVELIKSLGNGFSLLARAAAKTKTKTDDRIVSIFKEPVDEAAADDGIEI